MMDPKIEELELLLTDTSIALRHLRAQPRNAIVREDARRAADRADAYFARQKAEQLATENNPVPEDQRPAPRLPYADN